MKAIVKIAIPMTPNFLRYEGFENTAIPISQFTDKELRQIGKEWTEKLIEKARK